MPEEQTKTGQVITDSQIGTAEYFIASPFFAGFEDLKSVEYGKFLDIFETLGPYTKTYFSSPETSETIYSLGTKFELNDTEISAIASLVRDIIIGNVFIKDFPNLISSKLNIEEQKAKEIADYIISKSFQTIFEDVKKIQRTKFPQRIEQMRSAPQSASNPPLPQGQPSVTPPFVPPFTKPPVLKAPQSRPVNKSLEDELEKVASIIDLRNRSDK